MNKTEFSKNTPHNLEIYVCVHNSPLHLSQKPFFLTHKFLGMKMFKLFGLLALLLFAVESQALQQDEILLASVETENVVLENTFTVEVNYSEAADGWRIEYRNAQVLEPCPGGGFSFSYDVVAVDEYSGQAQHLVHVTVGCNLLPAFDSPSLGGTDFTMEDIYNAEPALTAAVRKELGL